MSTLANLKSTYERTKTKIFAKGEGDAEDREYFEEKEKVLFFEQVMTRLNKRSKKSMELFAEMSKLQNEIVVDINSLYSSDDRSYTTVSLIKEAATSGETNRQKMTERMERNSLRPIDEYCGSFREIKRRMDEYTIRRTDMERHRTEVAKLQEKGAASAPKLPMAEEKYKIALQRYEEMREELMVDLPALNNDRNTILGFLLASSLKSQAEYYTDLAEKFSVINSVVSSVDETAVIRHPKVITAPENSAAATNLRAHTVFNKGDKAGTQPMQPIKSPPPQHSGAPPPQNPTPQPLIQPQYTLQKQPTATPQPTQPDHSVYIAETASITTVFPTAPVVVTPVAPAFKPIKVIGLYDFTATEDNELSFKKGDIISIIAQQHGDWWEGEINGTAGLLPSNYVKEI